ncbi:ABC transporter permease [Actinoplanes sp. NPDC051859]|uniref:ABC transporter permease n=1 Tax=Actinoplanes sp. NPDC051859 TaxID=3363909 RepID=UPI0037B92409
MNSFVSLSRAMLLGFVRDKVSVFFTILFPLMFLVLFGGLLANQEAPRVEVIQIGAVPVLDSVPAAARTELDKVLKIGKSDSVDAALEEVRRGEADGLIRQEGDTIRVDYSAADRVRAGTLQAVLGQVVQGANLAGQPQRFTLRSEQVEDKSLKTIQYITPGLLGWAIATGATFGAALTLVSWRQKKILRRLRLSPVSTASVVLARVGTSVITALIQTAIFIGVAMLPVFGLQLSTYWWVTIPLVVLGTLSFLSIGLLAGAFAKTAEGASGIANLIVLPMAFLSGSFFPLDGAPAWLRTISQAFPLRHLNEAILDVMVRDQGPASVLPECGILLGFTVVVSAIAVKLFKWDDV